jgi:adenylylsulfate kinase-like enzyme
MKELNGNRPPASMKIIATIKRLLSSQQDPLVVALDGGSGAGKSTLAAFNHVQPLASFDFVVRLA